MSSTPEALESPDCHCRSSQRPGMSNTRYRLYFFISVSHLSPSGHGTSINLYSEYGTVGLVYLEGKVSVSSDHYFRRVLFLLSGGTGTSSAHRPPLMFTVVIRVS